MGGGSSNAEVGMPFGAPIQPGNSQQMQQAIQNGQGNMFSESMIPMQVLMGMLGNQSQPPGVGTSTGVNGQTVVGSAPGPGQSSNMLNSAPPAKPQPPPSWQWTPQTFSNQSLPSISRFSQAFPTFNPALATPRMPGMSSNK